MPDQLPWIPWDSQYEYSGEIAGEFTPDIEDPIVFVHGNGRNSQDWHPHFEYFKAKSVDPNRLWAISFDNSAMTHRSLANQLEHFVSNLLERTRATTLSVVSHSLGVTVSRYWMESYNRYNTVKKFVGIAGANHGLDVCLSSDLSVWLPESNRYKPCQYLGQSAYKTPPIEQLNETVGETPGDVEYYTIRGTNDDFYQTCRESPKLAGATNIELEQDHDGVRTCETTLKYLYQWIIE